MAKKRTSRTRRSSSGKAARVPGSPQLDALSQKCAEDPGFFKQLLDDPNATLGPGGGYNLNLTSGDIQRVKLAIEKGALTANVPIADLRSALNKFASTSEWSPTWICRWPPAGPQSERTSASRTRLVTRKRSSSGRGSR